MAAPNLAALSCTCTVQIALLTGCGGRLTTTPLSDASAPDGVVARADGSSDVDSADAACPRACPDPIADDGDLTKTLIPSAPAKPGACTSAMIEDFYQTCVGGVDPAVITCLPIPTWADAAHQTCLDCLTAGNGLDAAWGPYPVSTLSFVRLYGWINTAGCVDMLEPSALDCAIHLDDFWQCQQAHCPISPANMCYPEGPDEGADLLVQCTQLAASAPEPCGCADWSACAANLGPSARCVVPDVHARFTNVATAFCGQ